MNCFLLLTNRLRLSINRVVHENRDICLDVSMSICPSLFIIRIHMTQLCINKSLHRTPVFRKHPNQNSTTNAQHNAYRSSQPNANRIDQRHNCRIARCTKYILDEIFGCNDCGSLFGYRFCGHSVSLQQDFGSERIRD